MYYKTLDGAHLTVLSEIENLIQLSKTLFSKNAFFYSNLLTSKSNTLLKCLK